MSADRKIFANVIDAEETRVAIVEGGRLNEIFVERMWDRQRSGEIYKARVDKVIPGMNSAFLNLGDGRNAFLYLEDAKGIEVMQNSEILVQVTKTARKGKGARVTARISIPGRFLVLVTGGHETGVSRRISEEERERLRAFARRIRPQEAGIIVRTAAEGVDQDVLEEDLESLLNLWNEIRRLAGEQNAPCLIYQDLGLVGRILRDEPNGSVEEIIVDSEEEYANILSSLGRFSRNGVTPEVTLHSSSIPLFEYYGIEKDLETALNRKVWLDSGAYLVIDQTEALTVIDVNTGKFTGDGDPRSTILRTNLESAREIARQLRLRALGGIVVIDFIDMDDEGDQQKLIETLRALFRGDRCKARVFGVTPLGLVELTRKRARSDIRSTFTRGCPFCGGTGVVAREETIALDLKRFIRKVVFSGSPEALLIEIHPAAAAFISESFLPLWEEEFGIRIFLREVFDSPWEKFRLETQGTVEQAEHRIALLEQRGAGSVVHRTDPS
ncbi:MAG: Rne/Rng family ribonuclease [Thermovirgaceae bacterium]|nr:Rne/Rng family ribonuclease [Thermovirgaceae bacterium]